MASKLEALVRDVPDFPEPGIVFKDITPLLANGPAFRSAIEALLDDLDGDRIDAVVGIEARGFILAAPIAHQLGVGLVPVRKPKKLPWRTVRQEYALEYGTDALEAHADALAPGQRVLIVDDVLATGGTAAATCELVEQLGGAVVGVSVLIELAFLGGRSRLADRHVRSVLVFD
ncbi:MAG: adenine phosphoribosyltransferase [Acidimicrobiales bacterium]